MNRTVGSSTVPIQNDGLGEGPPKRTIRLLIAGLLAFAVGLTVLIVAYDLHRVRTATMLPTVPVSGLGAYQQVDESDDIKRGDVVRFRSDWPEAAGYDELTFRVIAKGGDRISGNEDGSISLNGTRLDEPYIDSSTPNPQTPFDVVVPDGRMFVAGDARGMSNDSRTHLDDGNSGTVRADAVSARLVGVAWPVWSWTSLSSKHGTPVPFIVASIMMAIGFLLIVLCGGRLLGVAHSARRERRAARRDRPAVDA